MNLLKTRVECIFYFSEGESYSLNYACLIYRNDDVVDLSATYFGGFAALDEPFSRPFFPKIKKK